jgi:hypothetical protein
MGHGVRAIVGKGEERLSDSEGFQNLFCLTMERERGFPQNIVPNLNVGPLNSISKAPSYCFQKSLFGCKTGCIALGRSRSFLTPEDFFLGEDPVEEVVSPTVHHPFDPFNIHDVDACSQNHLSTLVSGFKDSRVPGFECNILVQKNLIGISLDPLNPIPWNPFI